MAILRPGEQDGEERQGGEENARTRSSKTSAGDGRETVSVHHCRIIVADREADLDKRVPYMTAWS